MSLFYRESGKGFPLVILHGLYGSSDNWQVQAKALSEYYRVIAVDLRNHGASPHELSHSYSDLVTDLAWLFNELDIEQAHLLGHSMGGKAAIAFAADYPEHVKSLIVVDIAPRNYLLDPANAIQYDFHKQLLSTLNDIDPQTIESRDQIDSILKTFIPETSIRFFIMKSLHRNKNGKYQWKFNVPILFRALDSILSGVDASDYDDRIPITAYPVLFIKGALSGYITSDDEKLIQRMYPQSKLVQIEGATHLVHAEKPTEFLKVVREFLEQVH